MLNVSGLPFASVALSWNEWRLPTVAVVAGVPNDRRHVHNGDHDRERRQRRRHLAIAHADSMLANGHSPRRRPLQTPGGH
jgi:hypothetical protein